MALNLFGVPIVIGISITPTLASAIVNIRGRRIEREVSTSTSAPIADALDSILNATLPILNSASNDNRFGQRLTRSRAKLQVTLAAPWARLKIVEELPAADSRHTRLKLIAESAERVFVRQGPSIIVPAIDDERSWVACYDRATIEEIVRVAEAHHLSLQFVTTDTSNASRSESAGEITSTVNPIAAWRPKTNRLRQLMANSDRKVGVFIAALSFTILGIAIPYAMLAWRVGIEEDMAAAMSAGLKSASDTVRSIARNTAMAESFGTFDLNRRSAVRALAELSAALPPDIAVEQLRIDSVGGAVTLFGPGAMRAADALQHVVAFSSVEFSAPPQWIVNSRNAAASIPDSMPEEPKARATIRFRFAPAYARIAGTK